MRKYMTLAGLLLAVVGFSVPGWAEGKPSPGSDSASPSPAPIKAGSDIPLLGADTRLETLPNGLTVLVKVDKRFPMVSTRLFVHAGSAFETPKDAGISHFLEHMVFKGTTLRPKGEISREVEAAGGYLNAMTSFDYTAYINDLPADSWKLGMDVVRDMAFHPTLDEAELESEKDVVVAELKRSEDSPGSQVFQAIQAAALKGTPYAAPIIGYEKTIRNITVESMRAYRNKLYQPRNMLLVVAGNVNPDDVMAEARKAFGEYANTSPINLVQPLDAAALGNSGPAAVTVKTGPWNKVYLAVALPVPGFTDSRSAALDVLAHLLGGDATSYLYRTYKYERQLVDSISAGNYAFQRLGLIYVNVVLDADKLLPFWQAFTADMARLRADQFNKTQLDRAKLNLEDDYFRSRETLGELTTNLGYFQFFLGGEQGEINRLQAIRDVDTPMLQSLLDEWVKPERLTTVVMAPQTSPPELPAQLSAALEAVSDRTDTSNAPKTAATVTAPSTEVVDLGNGRTVVLVPDKTMPYVALNMLYSGGETLLTPQQQGLSSLTARLLTKGTERLDNTALTDYLADRAAGIGAATGRSGFSVRLSGQTRFVPDLFALLEEVLTKPAFRDEEVAREKIGQIAAIRSMEDQPMGLAMRKMEPFLFGNSVYGYDTLGSVSSVESFDKAAIQGFWDQQKTRPWVMAVSGDIDREQVLTFARSLPAPSAEKTKLEAPAWGSDHELSLHLKDRKQAHLMLVLKTVPLMNEDTPALGLLNAVLSGMGGPLFSKLRDEMGLGYTVQMFMRQDMENGYAVFYIGTDPEKLAKARQGFVDQINNVRAELFTAGDLERGVKQIEGEYYRESQSLGSRAGEAAALAFTDRSQDYFQQYLAKIKKLNPEDLRKVARKYLDPNLAYEITVTP